jgi:hypothetical protein
MADDGDKQQIDESPRSYVQKSSLNFDAVASLTIANVNAIDAAFTSQV